VGELDARLTTLETVLGQRTVTAIALSDPERYPPVFTADEAEE
jgi:hypothetical protein